MPSGTERYYPHFANLYRWLQTLCDHPNNLLMTYKTSLDATAKVITVSITILFAALIAMDISLIDQTGRTVSILVLVGLLSIYFITFSIRPISYSLTGEKLIIQRPLKNVTISRSVIKSVEQLGSDKLSGTIRTFGVGGLFGYFGKFANRKLGNMTWYATRRDKAVLVRTVNNQKIILTPNNPEQFVTDFNG
jgi:FtsH-binding integral membrane protein